MKVEIDLPEIEGFEYTGEYRSAETGEYISINNHVITAQGHIYEYPILKKKEPEYRVTTINGNDVVSINALEDLLVIIDRYGAWSNGDISRLHKIKILIK